MSYYQHYGNMALLQHQGQFDYFPQRNASIGMNSPPSYLPNRSAQQPYRQNYRYTRASLIHMKPCEIRKIFRYPDAVLVIRRKEQVRLAVSKFRLNERSRALKEEKEKLEKEIEMLKLNLEE